MQPGGQLLGTGGQAEVGKFLGSLLVDNHLAAVDGEHIALKRAKLPGLGRAQCGGVVETKRSRTMFE